MDGTATQSSADTRESQSNADTRESDTPLAGGGADRKESRDGAGSWLLAPLRWFRQKFSGAVRWVAKLLQTPLRGAARIPLWLITRKWFRRVVGALMTPRKERGFGFWWLVATMAIAGAVGLVVATLLTPVAGILAVLVVGIWAIVSRVSGRRADAKRRDGTDKADRSTGSSEAEAPDRAQRAPVATAPATG